MQNSSSVKTRCSYVRHPNGVHEIIYHDWGFQAVDEMINLVRKIIDQNPEGEVIRLLTSRAEGLPPGELPVAYTAQKFRDLFRTLERKPLFKQAILRKSDAIASIINTFVRLSRASQLRFFPPDKRDEAIAWLLNN
jgi:hypothetical protein